ncbi:MAG: MFS transporter [Marinilabiliaceae bacterium]|nr:MFS transporter [Marinilabiliaceae bacterium]
MNNYSKFALQPNRFPFFYGFLIVGVGILGILVSIPGQTIGLSAFTNPVMKAMNLTRDQYSFAYGLGTFASSLILTHAGKLYDRFGVRIVAAVATIIMSTALTLLSFSSQITQIIYSILNTDTWIIPFVLLSFLFFMLRFSGQGILTLASKNMVMKWFDSIRGRVNAFMSIFISLGFSISPLWLNIIIDEYSWENAWLILSIGVASFSVIIFFTFHDNPEQFGLKQDGILSSKKRKHAHNIAKKEYTLNEAVSKRVFWIYSLMLAFNGYFITGFTFHVESIFEMAGLDKSTAFSIFLPTSVVSVIISFTSNILSDFIKLKNLLITMITGAMIFTIGVVTLSFSAGYYLIIIGSGIMGGLFSVLSTIVWPRFFGRKHLGAISSKSMSLIVVGSAIAPALFSLSNTYTGSYNTITYISLAFLFFLLIETRNANNPQ